MKDKHNDSIQCTVSECKYHCNYDDYCTLDQINVTKNTPNATEIECTDCASFESK